MNAGCTFSLCQLYPAMNPVVSFKVVLNQIEGSFTTIVHYGLDVDKRNQLNISVINQRDLRLCNLCLQ